MPNTKDASKDVSKKPLFNCIVFNRPNGEAVKINLHELAGFYEYCMDEVSIDPQADIDDVISSLEEYVFAAKLKNDIEGDRIKCLRILKGFKFFMSNFFTAIDHEHLH